ncbi:hypothetical protein QAD02_002480 [Eretmocerus hayati]|uniref:Uncharacterized protein n=1 Tax=Eretmocerus hayati TaxID=131215 RepID=A0ACC2NJZ1_9HYME|nr:hypothetical protein QAD02_002480 [Eretmocerus hayati]
MQQNNDFLLLRSCIAIVPARGHLQPVQPSADPAPTLPVHITMESEDQVPSLEVTESRVKYIDDDTIEWVPIQRIREFVRIPPNHSADFDRKKIYRALWTNPKTGKSQVLGVTIADFACGDEDKDLKAGKRGHFETIDTSVIQAYYHDCSGLSELSPSEENTGNTSDESNVEAEDESQCDDDAPIDPRASNKKTTQRKKKRVKRHQKARKNQMTLQRMSKEAFVLGARDPRHSDQSASSSSSHPHPGINERDYGASEPDPMVIIQNAAPVENIPDLVRPPVHAAAVEVTERYPRDPVPVDANNAQDANLNRSVQQQPVGPRV